MTYLEQKHHGVTVAAGWHSLATETPSRGQAMLLLCLCCAMATALVLMLRLCSSAWPIAAFLLLL
jgi:hypothetical protein